MAVSKRQTSCETAIAVAIVVLNKAQGATLGQIHTFVNQHQWLNVVQEACRKTTIQRTLSSTVCLSLRVIYTSPYVSLISTEHPAFQANGSGNLWMVDLAQLPSSVRSAMARLTAAQDASLSVLAVSGWSSAYTAVCPE
jgi:hypothetical protein